MAEQKRDTTSMEDFLQSAYCDELVARMEQRERAFKAKIDAQLHAVGKRALDGLMAIDPVKAAAVEAQMDAVTQTGLAGLKAAVEDIQTETKTTTTIIPYLDQPGRLEINWEGALKKMKELAWAVDGLRARCMDCQTDKNKATRHIDNWCTSCNVTLWNCAEWRRDQDKGGESISKYFSEHPVVAAQENMTDWMQNYFVQGINKTVTELGLDEKGAVAFKEMTGAADIEKDIKRKRGRSKRQKKKKEPAWKDVAVISKAKAILNTPTPVAPPIAPKTWEFSEGCEGSRTIAYLPV